MPLVLPPQGAPCTTPTAVHPRPIPTSASHPLATGTGTTTEVPAEGLVIVDLMAAWAVLGGAVAVALVAGPTGGVVVM